MHLNWLLVTCLLVLLSVGLTSRTVDASKKSKEETKEEEADNSTDTEVDTDDDDDDDDDETDDEDDKHGKAHQRIVFIPRERASIFLSYNECLRRMNCGITRKEECSEECAIGNTEEEMEEYTEMFEHIEEYRSDLKKTSSIKKKSIKKQVVSSSSDTDNDGDSTDTTTSDMESDASSEEEDEPINKNKNKKLKSTKKN